MRTERGCFLGVLCGMLGVILIIAGCSWIFGGGESYEAVVAFDKSTVLGDALSRIEVIQDLAVMTRLPIINGFSCQLTDKVKEKLEELFDIRYIEKSVTVYALELETPGTIGSTSVAEIPDESAVNWDMEMIGADEVWNINQGVGVKVGVLDTGIDPDHPDFLDNGVSCVASGFNAITGGSAEDDHGHGTSVASTIGARRNGLGIIGVARGCTLVPIKVLGSTGSGSSIDVVEGYQWALDHNVQVMNISLGSYMPSIAMQEAMENARALGMGTCAATGNDGRPDMIYPARNSYAICVGAVGTDGSRKSWSNYGPEMMLNGCAAPGDWVLVAQMGGGWRRVSGTSIAAPHVTGQLAVLVGMGFGWREFIFRSASLPDSPTSMLGHGLIDVPGSVKLLENYNARE